MFATKSKRSICTLLDDHLIPCQIYCRQVQGKSYWFFLPRANGRIRFSIQPPKWISPFFASFLRSLSDHLEGIFVDNLNHKTHWKLVHTTYTHRYFYFSVFRNIQT